MASDKLNPEPSGKLAEIFSKMNMSELPAMSHNVQELISLTCSTRSAGTELSRVILKDYSLTNKVLQVVNSAYYSLGRQCNSISRAVTILGFDAVRDLATAIALFEEFVKSGVDKESVSKLLTKSFLSGLQARDLAVEKELKIIPEEAFICTLLHNLGKIIVSIYLPDKIRAIEDKIAQGDSVTKASKEILSGLTLQEIGEEVAKFWNLSEKVISAMGEKPKSPKDAYDTNGYLHNLAYFSNSIVDKLCDGSNLAPLLEEYGEMFSIDGEEVIEKFTQCVEVSEDISDSIRYGLSKLKVRSKIRNAEKNAKNGVFSSKLKTIAPDGDAESTQSFAEKKSDNIIEELNELPISTDKSVNDFIRDITETLMGNFDLNEFYVNLLEGLYRGIGFDRVIIAIVTVQPNQLSLIGRFGLGDIESDTIKNFEHVISQGNYAIPNSLKLCKDMMIPANKPKAFPENFHELVKDRTVYLFPISIGKKSIGMLYLDRKKGRPLLDKGRVKTVRLFRDFAVMAIRKIRK